MNWEKWVLNSMKKQRKYSNERYYFITRKDTAQTENNPILKGNR
jgi:uncharacterized protein YqeY